jgi:hypothetical protein
MLFAVSRNGIPADIFVSFIALNLFPYSRVNAIFAV